MMHREGGKLLRVGKRVIVGRKIQVSAKKGRQKLLACASKNLEGAENLRPTPGGRHPSSTTDVK